MSTDGQHHDFDPDTAFKDYAREPVPEHALRPSWRLFAIWIVTSINLPYMMTGTVFAQGLTLGEAYFSLIAGQLLMAGTCLSG